jgi:hypothetical protein
MSSDTETPGLRRAIAVAALNLGYFGIEFTAWPDLLVGLGIALVNAGAAREVWFAARREGRAANA